jgi:primosomal protein N' (replication factor Y)
MTYFYQVYLKGAFFQAFTYFSTDLIEEGSIVKVSFRKKIVLGLVYKITKEFPKSLPILEVIDHSPNFHFIKWVCDFYYYPFGQFFFENYHTEKQTPIITSEFKKIESSQEQNSIIEKITPNIFHKYYLYGSTGSGKTHLLMKLAQTFEKKQVLYLTPEINLSEEFFRIFKPYLQNSAIYHSLITPSQKKKITFQVKNFSNTVILGSRSSLFLPFHNLGLIIIDEEHDSSYKQEERCSYNGRDAAIKLASMLGIPVVLASATPSLENYQKFFLEKTTDHTLLTLTASPLKNTLIFEPDSDKNLHYYPFSLKSLKYIKEALLRKEQVLIFVHGLGFSKYLYCNNCENKFQCPHCDLKLRYFQYKKKLQCYYCNYSEHFDETCKQCQSKKIFYAGYGTEFILEKLQSIFPSYTFKRFDKEEITNIKKLNSLLESFHNHSIDGLIGTQLLSKGYNFKNAHTIVLLGLDSFLSFIDFRASEKAIQKIMQTLGRVGRFKDNSTTIIQHNEPHELLNFLEQDKFFSYYDILLLERKNLLLPPFSVLCTLVFSHKKKDALLSFFEQYHLYFQEKNVEILGPQPFFIEKRKNFFSWFYLIKASSYQNLHLYLQKIHQLHLPITPIINIQPINFT